MRALNILLLSLCLFVSELTSPIASESHSNETALTMGDALMSLTSRPCTNCDVDNWREKMMQRELLNQKKWKEAGFIDSKFEHWAVQDIYEIGELGKTTFTHSLKISAVIFKSSNWKKDEVKVRFKKLAKIYSKCGIQVSGIDVIESHYPKDWIDADASLEKTDGKIASMTPVTERPIFYYTDSHKEKDLAYSYYGDSPQGQGKLDTAWISSGLKKPEAAHFDSDMSTEAHELAHILTKSGHLKERKKNILADEDYLVSADITEAQCKKMKKHSSLKPLKSLKKFK